MHQNHHNGADAPGLTAPHADDLTPKNDEAGGTSAGPVGSQETKHGDFAVSAAASKRQGTVHAPQVVGAKQPRLADEIAAMLASVVLAGVRINPSPSGHTLTLRGSTVQCTDLLAVRDVLRRWGGQP